jgi:hypothetical protein
MKWPSDKICELIGKLWAAGTWASNVAEGQAALAALKRSQVEHGLSDVMVAYIGESHNKPADDANVLDAVLEAITSSKIIMTFEQALVVALWVLHTYVFFFFLHTARLLVQSHKPGCGKTALGHLVEAMACNSDFSSSVSAAVIYHTLRKDQHTTFILDEIENSRLWADDRLLLSVFDAGHRKGGNVKRVIKGEVVKFPVFAPLMMMAVKQKAFAPQLLSRSILIHMEKRVEGQDEIDPSDPRFSPIRAALSHWAGSFQRPENCELPRELVGREGADNWRALIEIGSALGYSATARAVALAMYRSTADPVRSLLWDIRCIRELPAPAGYTTDKLGRATGLWTEDLLTAMHHLPDTHWDELGLDDGLAPRKLGRKDLLRMLHTEYVRTRDVWKQIDGKRVSKKGFYFKDFERVWLTLFGDTPTQSSKIISLPRHSRRHGGDTGDSMEEEIA